MAYAVAAIVKKDGKPYVDMAAVNAAPAGTFFWVGLATNCPKSDLLPLCDSLFLSVSASRLCSAARAACIW